MPVTVLTIVRNSQLFDINSISGTSTSSCLRNINRKLIISSVHRLNIVSDFYGFAIETSFYSLWFSRYRLTSLNTKCIDVEEK